MPQRQHELAHARLVGVAQQGHRQATPLDLEQRQVHALVEPHQPAIEAPAVGQTDLDAVGVAHHVGVRHQVAVLPDDEARARAASLLG